MRTEVTRSVWLPELPVLLMVPTTSTRLFAYCVGFFTPMSRYESPPLADADVSRFWPLWSALSAVTPAVAPAPTVLPF
ncbi:MAG TPA: hypothetical protein VKC15_03105 [Gemmatimonadales bacterium]|nr:hypothetical protein [Gemmatimonadales bacterium]